MMSLMTSLEDVTDDITMMVMMTADIGTVPVVYEDTCRWFLMGLQCVYLASFPGLHHLQY